MNDAPKLEKGGLALIIGALQAVDNIGREVTLGDYIAPGDKLFFRGGVVTGAEKYGTWLINADSLLVICRFPSGEVETFYSDTGFAQSNHLMPLKDKGTDLSKQKDRPLEKVT